MDISNITCITFKGLDYGLLKSFFNFRLGFCWYRSSFVGLYQFTIVQVLKHQKHEPIKFSFGYSFRIDLNKWCPHGNKKPDNSNMRKIITLQGALASA